MGNKNGPVFRKVCVFDVSRAVSIARFESVPPSESHPHRTIQCHYAKQRERCPKQKVKGFVSTGRPVSGRLLGSCNARRLWLIAYCTEPADELQESLGPSGPEIPEGLKKSPGLLKKSGQPCPSDDPKNSPDPQKPPRGTKGPSNQNPLKTPEFYPLKTTQRFCTTRVFAPLLVQKVVQKKWCNLHRYLHHLVQKHGAKTRVFAPSWCKTMVQKQGFLHHLDANT